MFPIVAVSRFGFGGEGLLEPSGSDELDLVLKYDAPSMFSAAATARDEGGEAGDVDVEDIDAFPG